MTWTYIPGPNIALGAEGDNSHGARKVFSIQSTLQDRSAPRGSGISSLPCGRHALVSDSFPTSVRPNFDFRPEAAPSQHDFHMLESGVDPGAHMSPKLQMLQPDTFQKHLDSIGPAAPHLGWKLYKPGGGEPVACCSASHMGLPASDQADKMVSDMYRRLGMMQDLQLQVDQTGPKQLIVPGSGSRKPCAGDVAARTTKLGSSGGKYPAVVAQQLRSSWSPRYSVTTKTVKAKHVPAAQKPQAWIPSGTEHLAKLQRRERLDRPLAEVCLAKAAQRPATAPPHTTPATAHVTTKRTARPKAKGNVKSKSTIQTSEGGEAAKQNVKTTKSTKSSKLPTGVKGRMHGPKASDAVHRAPAGRRQRAEQEQLSDVQEQAAAVSLAAYVSRHHEEHSTRPVSSATSTSVISDHSSASSAHLQPAHDAASQPAAGPASMSAAAAAAAATTTQRSQAPQQEQDARAGTSGGATTTITITTSSLNSNAHVVIPTSTLLPPPPARPHPDTRDAATLTDQTLGRSTSIDLQPTAAHTTTSHPLLFPAPISAAPGTAPHTSTALQDSTLYPMPSFTLPGQGQPSYELDDPLLLASPGSYSLSSPASSADLEELERIVERQHARLVSAGILPMDDGFMHLGLSAPQQPAQPLSAAALLSAPLPIFATSTSTVAATRAHASPTAATSPAVPSATMCCSCCPCCSCSRTSSPRVLSASPRRRPTAAASNTHLSTTPAAAPICLRHSGTSSLLGSSLDLLSPCFMSASCADLVSAVSPASSSSSFSWDEELRKLGITLS